MHAAIHDVSRTTGDPAPDSDQLDGMEQEALAWIQATRELLFSQRPAAEWSVKAACDLAWEREQDLSFAEAESAHDLVFGATEATEPEAAVVTLLNGGE